MVTEYKSSFWPATLKLVWKWPCLGSFFWNSRRAATTIVYPNFPTECRSVVRREYLSLSLSQIIVKGNFDIICFWIKIFENVIWNAIVIVIFLFLFLLFFSVFSYSYLFFVTVKNAFYEGPNIIWFVNLGCGKKGFCKLTN